MGREVLSGAGEGEANEAGIFGEEQVGFTGEGILLMDEGFDFEGLGGFEDGGHGIAAGTDNDMGVELFDYFAGLDDAAGIDNEVEG